MADENKESILDDIKIIKIVEYLERRRAIFVLLTIQINKPNR